MRLQAWKWIRKRRPPSTLCTRQLPRTWKIGCDAPCTMFTASNQSKIRPELTPFAEIVCQYTPRGSPAVLGPQETVHLVTLRAREVLNDLHETASRALVQQQRRFRAATHQYEAVARQNLVIVLEKNIMRRTIIMCRCKFDSSNKKQMRDCRKYRGNLFLRQKASQSLKDQREIMASEVTS